MVALGALLLLGLDPWRCWAQTPSGAPPDYPASLLQAGQHAVRLVEQGRFAQALPFWRQLLDWQEQRIGTTAPLTLRTLGNLAALELTAGHVAEAAEHYAELHGRLLRLQGPDSPETLQAALDLARAWRTQSRFQQAEALIRQTLTTLHKSDTTDPGWLRRRAEAQELLATLLHEQGRYGDADTAFRAALSLRLQLEGDQGRGTVLTRANLAQAVLRQGRFADALQLQRQALAAVQQSSGDQRRLESTLLANIAFSKNMLGQKQEALQDLAEAVRLKVQSLGENHPETARLILNMAAMEADLGDHNGALEHSLKAFAVLSRNLGQSNLGTAFAMQRIAELSREVGQPRMSIQWYEAALSIRRQQLRPEHPDLATSLFGLGLAQLQIDEVASATRHLSEALRLRDRALGPSHPYTALTGLLLAMVDWDNHRISEAHRHFRSATRAYAQFLRNEAALLPISERGRLLATIKESRNVLYSLALQGAAGRDLAMLARINLHGLLEELERRQALLLLSNPDLQKALDRRAQLISQLSQVGLADSERDQLGQQRNQLERQLFQQLSQTSDTHPWIERDDIASALPKDGVLVEFLRYDPVRLKHGDLVSTAPSRYAALILESSGNSVAVDLGPAEQIHRAIWSALARTQQVDLDFAQPWLEVSQLIIQPLLSRISAKKKWYFSPDGELHRIPYAALGSGDPEHFRPFADHHQLRLLTSARDLLPVENTRVSPAASLVMADPDFNADLGSSRQQSARDSSRQRGEPLPEQWRSTRWTRLPGTAKEGRSVQSLIGADYLTETAARSAVLNSVHSPLVLHIASHGAFLPRPKPSSASQQGNRLHALEGKSSNTDDPMLRGVVILAGANRVTPENQDDGLVTALEFSRLDLRGTLLVTLSACETGVGSVEVGDGLYGLRRGLAVAGARSSLLSLWMVEDEATNALMQQFYGALRQGRSPEQALAIAQTFMRTNANLSWHHPYYWASFQLYGKSW